jgi:C-terminal processing protease CtpA/Prc
MRYLNVVLVVAASASVVGAQQQRVSTSRGDSVVIFRSGSLSSGELRAMTSELMALQQRTRALEEQLARLRQNDGPPQQIEEIERRLAQAMSEYYPRQSALTLVCQSALASEARAEGYLGLTFDEEIMISESRPGVADIAVRFAGAPRIVAVEAGSPAQRAGVRVGDEWVSLATRKLDGATVRDLDALLKPGLKHPLRVRRAGREIDLTVEVGKRVAFPSTECQAVTGQAMLTPLLDRALVERAAAQASAERAAVATLPRATAPRPPQPPRQTYSFIAPSTPTVYGASLRALDADARDFVSYTGEGVLVDRVIVGSAAEQAGLKAFDVIVRINGQPLSAPGTVVAVLQQSRRSELLVHRKGTTRTVVLER